MKLGIILEHRIDEENIEYDEENVEKRIIKIETNNSNLERILNKAKYIDKHRYEETDTITHRKTFFELCDVLDEVVKPYCNANEIVIFACTADGYAFIYDDSDLVDETMKYIFNE